ncbi:MBL fold metallo-hydrolase [Floricoccus penangensis]|uniref:MBL fold metallo-hydrolase n=1 Tax=Floricoccus penangensis TaxID=1859475 RepID=UPI002041A9A8|nr:MBL fold metallo-hydrolase [Floricoccus penangensis]URZ88391.1 MBL fold metallo-hydrolase [Floricoccus penangensis]
MELKDKNKTIVTFHSGIMTIGGTVIEVSYNDSHIFFDFGTEFRPELNLKDESLETLLKNRLIPAIPAVYDKNLSTGLELPTIGEFNHTAVFLSHVHLDHSKMVNYLDEDIPLYAFGKTEQLLKSLNRAGTFLIPSPDKELSYVRPITKVEQGEIVTVGEITVEMMPVDHDAYGATGFLIRTPDKFLVYTGDLRLHGYDAQDTIDFCNNAQDCDMLMMEGVSVSFSDNPRELDIETFTEEDLVESLVELELENPDRQITFNGYPANLKRFAKIVERSPRTVVLEVQMAALLAEIFNIEVAYYYSSKNPEKVEFLDESLEIPYENLLTDKGEYLWQIVDNFENLQNGSLYIHSDAEPLGDFDPAYAKFLKMLASKNIEFTRLSCSGHARPRDLDKIIAMIHPKLLVPIHTLKPENLENPYGERILPRRGQKIILQGE